MGDPLTAAAALAAAAVYVSRTAYEFVLKAKEVTRQDTGNT